MGLEAMVPLNGLKESLEDPLRRAILLHFYSQNHNLFFFSWRGPGEKLIA